MSSSIALAQLSTSPWSPWVTTTPFFSSRLELDHKNQVLQIPMTHQLLEAGVEAVDEEEPGVGLLGKVGGVQVKLLGLRVQALLVQVGLWWSGLKLK